MRLGRHTAVPGIVAGVNFEGQIVCNRQFDTLGQRPIAQTEHLGFAHTRWVTQIGRQRLRCFVIAARSPQQRAIVGMLRLDSDCHTRILCKNFLHRPPQRCQIMHLDTGLLAQLRQIGLTVDKVDPRDVVKEEIRPRGIDQTGADKIIGLYMIQIGFVAQKVEPLTGLAIGGMFGLRRFERLGRDLLNVVEFTRQDAHCFAIASVTYKDEIDLRPKRLGQITSDLRLIKQAEFGVGRDIKRKIDIGPRLRLSSCNRAEQIKRTDTFCSKVGFKRFKSVYGI